MKGFLESIEKVTLTKESPFSEGDWPLYIELTDGQIVGCDLVIQATGVQPNSDLWKASCSDVSTFFY